VNILFVGATRIGDAVLTTGLLDRLVAENPDARVALACGAPAMPLFAAAPKVVRRIPLVKRGGSGHWLDLWRRCIGTRWDLIIDLRGSAIAYLLAARRRMVYRRGADDNAHRLVDLARAFGLAEPPAPRVWTSAEDEAEAARLVPPGGPVLMLGPTANWPGKIWRAENFVAQLEQAADNIVGAVEGQEQRIRDALAASVRNLESLPEMLSTARTQFEEGLGQGADGLEQLKTAAAQWVDAANGLNAQFEELSTGIARLSVRLSGDEEEAEAEPDAADADLAEAGLIGRAGDLNARLSMLFETLEQSVGAEAIEARLQAFHAGLDNALEKAREQMQDRLLGAQEEFQLEAEPADPGAAATPAPQPAADTVASAFDKLVRDMLGRLDELHTEAKQNLEKEWESAVAELDAASVGAATAEALNTLTFKAADLYQQHLRQAMDNTDVGELVGAAVRRELGEELTSLKDAVARAGAGRREADDDVEREWLSYAAQFIMPWASSDVMDAITRWDPAGVTAQGARRKSKRFVKNVWDLQSREWDLLRDTLLDAYRVAKTDERPMESLLQKICFFIFVIARCDSFTKREEARKLLELIIASNSYVGDFLTFEKFAEIEQEKKREAEVRPRADRLAN